MSYWVALRSSDGRYYSGLRDAPWNRFVSGAAAFESKGDAISEIVSRGYRLAAFLYLELPVPRDIKARKKSRSNDDI